MKKRDRALKRKGYHQVSASREDAVKTVALLKNQKGDVVRTINRYWAK